MLMQPGETISPGNSSSPAPLADQPLETEDKPETPPTDPALANNGRLISWTASEYVAHQKNSGWYVLLGLGAVLITGVVYFVTRDVVSSVVTLLGATMFGVFAARQPKVLTYELSQHGIRIGQKFYAYTDFRSFSVQEEGVINSIFLSSMKRFMPGLTIYFPPDQEEQIIGTLGDFLPHEEKSADAIDRLMRKVRF